MIRYLSLPDVLYLAARLGEPQPRDVGLVESAVARPRTSVFGADAYPDRHTKAAALLHSLARNHAFSSYDAVLLEWPRELLTATRRS